MFDFVLRYIEIFASLYPNHTAVALAMNETSSEDEPPAKKPRRPEAMTKNPENTSGAFWI